MALAVPLSRFTPRVGGGSAFYVRPHHAHENSFATFSLVGGAFHLSLRMAVFSRCSVERCAFGYAQRLPHSVSRGDFDIFARRYLGVCTLAHPTFL